MAEDKHENQDTPVNLGTFTESDLDQKEESDLDEKEESDRNFTRKRANAVIVDTLFHVDKSEVITVGITREKIEDTLFQYLPKDITQLIQLNISKENVEKAFESDDNEKNVRIQFYRYSESSATSNQTNKTPYAALSTVDWPDGRRGIYGSPELIGKLTDKQLNQIAIDQVNACFEGKDGPRILPVTAAASSGEAHRCAVNLLVQMELYRQTLQKSNSKNAFTIEIRDPVLQNEVNEALETYQNNQNQKFGVKPAFTLDSNDSENKGLNDKSETDDHQPLPPTISL